MQVRRTAAVTAPGLEGQSRLPRPAVRCVLEVVQVLRINGSTLIIGKAKSSTSAAYRPKCRRKARRMAFCEMRRRN